MCFSATASFVTAGVLGAVGVATLKKNKTRSVVPFAAIPILFAIQQVIEGVIWLSFGSVIMQTVVTYAYSFFAYILWPIYLPLAVYLLEKDEERKTVLRVLTVLGLIIAVYMAYFIGTNGVTAEIVNYGIAYHTPYPHYQLLLGLYVLVTSGACLLSSHKAVNIFGLVMIAALFISAWFFIANLASVWCFFAATLSVIVYWQIRHPRKYSRHSRLPAGHTPPKARFRSKRDRG